MNQQRSLFLSQVVQTGFNNNVFAFSDAKRDSLSVLVDLSLNTLSCVSFGVVNCAADNACLADGKLYDAIGVNILFTG